MKIKELQLLAKTLGMDQFYTGKPCAKGHNAPRYAGSGKCVTCIAERSSNSYSLNRESVLERNREYYRDNEEAVASRMRNYRACNVAYFARYRADNKARLAEQKRGHYVLNREGILSGHRENYAKNKHKRTEWSRYRKAAKLQRTPSWLSGEHRARLREIYKEATRLRESGRDVHVDHIIPLQGELVSGLHVPENLQIIPAQENLSKGNSYTP